MRSLLAREIARRVKGGEVIGIGSGTTVELAVREIGRRIREERLEFSAIATSSRIERIADEEGVRLLSPASNVPISWAFDGADEVDPELNLLKGRGGAMLFEKVVAKRSSRFVVIVDEAKLVGTVGDKHRVPVEVLPFALPFVRASLESLGAVEIELLESGDKYGPVYTDSGNFILDLRFECFRPTLEEELKKITGVVESGLFIGYMPEVLVASGDGLTSRSLVGGRVVDRVVNRVAAGGA